MRSTASRTLVLTLAATSLAALSSGAFSFTDTHLDEIAAPLGTYADTRVAEIEALPSATKAEKKERGLLAKLAKKESKFAKALKSDFKELVFGGKTAKKLKEAAAGMQPALDEAFARAEIALGERREFVGDHVRIIPDAKTVTKIQKLIDKYDAQRAAANGAATDDKKAKALAKAEVFITKALKKAEKAAQKAVNENGQLRMPPIRLRSGDDVGTGGARVSIPVDAGSPIAGASVLIPPGALAATRRISIEEGDSFVGGRDTAAGVSVRFLPAGTQFNQPIEVSVPYTLPQDADPADLALFHDTGNEVTATLDVTLGESGLLTGEATSFSEFQAGLLAPPLGAPSGTYHVELMSVIHRLSSDGSEESSEALSISGQDFTFRADGSGRSSVGSAVLVFRNTAQFSPHHIDGYSGTSAGSVDFAWTLVEQGRFGFSFPTQLGDVAVAEGVVSTSGDVIAFIARGGPIEYLAVGVRAGDAPTAEDFEGRWMAVELGMHLLDSGEDFRTRTFSSFTGFDVSATENELTFHDTGITQSADRRFRTESSPSTHERALSSVSDAGVEDFSILFSGQIGADQNRRTGRLDPSRTLFVSHRGDAATRSVSMLLAVKQPATADPDLFEGFFRLARLDLTPRADSPVSSTSTFDVDPGVGTFDVDASGNVNVVMEAVTRATYSLTTAGAVNNRTWTSTQTLSDATGPTDNFQLQLDAAGNHRPTGTDRWYGFSGDGTIVLGAAPGADDDGLRGIAIGLR